MCVRLLLANNFFSAPMALRGMTHKVEGRSALVCCRDDGDIAKTWKRWAHAACHSEVAKPRRQQFARDFSFVPGNVLESPDDACFVPLACRATRSRPPWPWRMRLRLPAGDRSPARNRALRRPRPSGTTRNIFDNAVRVLVPGILAGEDGEVRKLGRKRLPAVVAWWYPDHRHSRSQ